MKKIILSLVVLLVGAYVMAEDNPPLRSTNVATTDLFNVFVASGTIKVKRVVINTGVASSTFKLFNGSASTGTAVVREVIDTAAAGQREYDMVFSSGLMYGKGGAANVTLVWDWWKVPTPGRETIGR